MKILMCCTLVAVFASVVDSASNCALNQNDREFCNTFNTVCLSQRDRSCLARSLKMCLPQVDLPRSTLGSLVDYVDRYLMAIYTPVTTTVAPPRGKGETKIEITFQTGVRFIDYILSYLASFKDIRIRQSVKKYTKNPGLQVINDKTQDVDIIVKKIEYIFANFSKYRLNAENLRKWLVYLKNQKTNYYQWFSAITDGVLTDLGVATVEKDTTVIGNVIFDWYVVLEPTSVKTVSYSFCHGKGKEQDNKCERYCTDSYGGNWILMQTRERKNEITTSPFDKNLYAYAEGFGNTETGYWMGLGCLHQITKGQQHELLVELTNANGQVAVAHYDSFSVGTVLTGYQLNLGRFLGGAAGDALRSSNGLKFSANDHDYDQNYWNCAQQLKGGWWFGDCAIGSPLNALNVFFAAEGRLKQPFGVRWASYNSSAAITKTRMMIRTKKEKPIVIGDIIVT